MNVILGLLLGTILLLRLHLPLRWFVAFLYMWYFWCIIVVQ